MAVFAQLAIPACGRGPKNSSLAFFIGYPELFSIGRIMINQAGRAVPVFAMIMLTYLAMSLLTSFVLNLYNRRIQFVER